MSPSTDEKTNEQKKERLGVGVVIVWKHVESSLSFRRNLLHKEITGHEDDEKRDQRKRKKAVAWRRKILRCGSQGLVARTISEPSHPCMHAFMRWI